MPKIVHFGACGQTGQKLVENAKIEKFKYDILSNFQTIFSGIIYWETILWVVAHLFFLSLVVAYW